MYFGLFLLYISIILAGFLWLKKQGTYHSALNIIFGVFIGMGPYLACWLYLMFLNTLPAGRSSGFELLLLFPSAAAFSAVIGGFTSRVLKKYVILITTVLTIVGFFAGLLVFIAIITAIAK